jgi:hypothetical protein
MNAITEPRMFFDYDCASLHRELRDLRDELGGHEIDQIVSALHNALSADGPYYDDDGSSGVLSRGASKAQVVCLPLVIAIAREVPSNRREFTLTGAIQALTSTYSKCRGVTSIGVLITDVWRPSNLKNHEYDLRTARNNGIRTVPVLINGRLLKAIKFPWE